MASLQRVEDRGWILRGVRNEGVVDLRVLIVIGVVVVVAILADQVALQRLQLTLQLDLVLGV